MTSVAQRSFAGGEISPALYGRADQAKYSTGARTILNFIVQRFGGVTNRPGSRMIRETNGSTAGKSSRLRRWVYNDSTTYLLEFGDLTLRLIQTSGGTTGPVSASGILPWDIGTTYLTGEIVSYSGGFYYAKTGSLAKQPNTNPTEWYLMPSQAIEIPTPYAHGDVRRLQFVQSADVLTICHPSYPVYELRRYSANRWVLTPSVFAPTIAAPTMGAVTNGTAGAIVFNYKVTAVLPDTFEESLGSSVGTCTGGLPTTTNPNLVNWTAVSGALEYNVYKEASGVYGFIGTARGTQFKDINFLPSATETLATPATVFDASGKYPQTTAYAQQRQVFAGATSTPESIKLSRTGVYHDFSTSSPLQDDDAIGFSINGDEVQEVRHVVNLSKLLVFTAGGVWTIDGDTDGVIRPTAINPNQLAQRGASYLRPAIVGNSALYVQARGTIVRDIQLDVVKGSTGRDLTIYAQHLFDGYTIVAWAYQENPHSVLWAVRSDGVMLGLTYVPEHDVWSWSRFTTDGLFLDVECVPEEGEDALYVIVRRTINGTAHQFVERMASRRITDMTVDAMFVDCGLTFDGRYTTIPAVATMTLTTGTTWAYTEPLTLTCSSAKFLAGDVGNDFILTIGSEKLRVHVKAFTSVNVVTVEAEKDVPVAFQGVATLTWARATATFTGLSHLEGKSVAIMADGNVIANGYDDPQYVVTGGSVTIPTPAAVVHIGLPYTADLETLDWEDPQAETLMDKRKLVQGVTLLVQDTRGGWAGCPRVADDGTAAWLAKYLNEIKQRATEGYGSPVATTTGTFDISVPGAWGEKGRILVRQRDPLPMTILAAIPRGKTGG